MATVTYRRQGVYGQNLPPKTNQGIRPANFKVAGIAGQFERKYNRTFAVSTPSEAQEIFGGHVIPSFYGWDVLNGLFANARGVDVTLYIQSYVGNTGSSIDAATASDTVNSQGTGDPSVKLQAAYKGEPEYGVSGNRTSYKIVNGVRFTTQLAANVSSGATSAQLDSVAGIQVGDVMHFTDSGGNYDEHHKITNINASTKTVTWDDTDANDSQWGATGGTAGDTAEVMGFQVKTFRQDRQGTEVEVEKEIGRTWCTMEPEVTDFYVDNVLSQNAYLEGIDQDASASANYGDTFPVDVSSVTYLTGGSDGTSPSASAWDFLLRNFDEDPIRLLSVVEETTKAVHDNVEAYCAGRDDTPIAMYVWPEDQTKDQLIQIGQNYQRSDEVLFVGAANWLKVDDPFAGSPVAPDRHVPNVGHLMGQWFRGIDQNGLHYVPAVRNLPILGANDVVGYAAPSDDDRTDLAEAGVNVIQNIQGSGLILRSWFTPSTSLAYRFGNGLLMRNFIKVSIVDALVPQENTPNSLQRILENRITVLQFLYRLWERGANGDARTGDFFGQGVTADGDLTQPTDHFEVVADQENNPQTAINRGERNIDLWFTYPSPAGSIQVGVGILLRS